MRERADRFLKYLPGRDSVFIFGAGASYADGAPLQSELLPYILSEQDLQIKESRLGKEVLSFLREQFFISNNTFPSLEAVFGYIDYFILHRESLGGDYTTSHIMELKESLIKLLHYTISKHRKIDGKLYRQFWESASNRTLNIGVISTNYDTLIDEAFDFLYPDKGYIDYCLQLMNYDQYEKHHQDIDAFNWWINPREPVPIWEGSNPRPIKLIKLHGSLNWKYCNCCGQVLLTPWSTEINLDRKGFIRYDYSEDSHSPEIQEFKCPLDGTRFDTLIVPPSHVKELTNPIITHLRAEAAREIRCAKRLIFIGYSFPEADVHLKALFRKNIAPEAEVIVINRTISPQIKTAFLSISRKAKFREVTFEEALNTEKYLEEIFD